MKGLLFKISSFLLAFLVFFSTMSFTVDKHFCSEELVDLAIFSEAESCRMETQGHQDVDSVVEDCCENHQTTVEGQDELANNKDLLELEQVVFLTTFTFSYINLFIESTEQIGPSKNYNPPLLVQNIHVVNETFLI